MRNERQNHLSILSRLLKKQWVKGFCVFLLVFGVIWQASNYVSLVYSRTNSLPYSLFLNLKQVKPERGQYTCFECPWYGGRVIKKIVGMGGDILFYDDKGDLWIETVSRDEPLGVATLRDASPRVATLRDASPRIDHYSTRVDFLKIGKHKERSKDGRLLTPIKAGVIPQGKVFVVGDHERSFDSRYEELGLISEKVLQGRLLALV